MSYINKINYNGQEYDLYGLGGDVLPIGSEIDIASDAQIPAGWEEVDNKYEIYSETERCIGRWIDGKPIYRQVVFISNSINKTEESSTSTIEDVDNIITLSGFCKWNNTFLFPIPYISAQFNQAVQIFYKNDTKKIYIGTNMTITDVYSIIEYTKTTDTANTPITKKIRKVTQSVPPALLDDYSEEEKMVGTWINGKPLYRKVYNITNIPKSKYDYQLDIDNTCVVNTINVYYYDDNRTFCVQNPWYEFMQVYLKQNNVLRIEKNTIDSWTQNCYVILEYTKTTD